MTEANTVTMRIYHPNASGYATATFAFVDGQLPLASDLETMITNRGWLLEQPGLEPGEDAESILYVCRQNKEEEDGTITPKISFYSEVEHLVMRWLGDYLNNEKEIADFEAATGLQVDKLPVWTDSIPPKRTDKKAQKFIIKLAKPIRVVRETYHTKDGDPRHKFVRFVDYIGNVPATANKDSYDGAMAEHQRQQNGTTPIAPDFTPEKQQVDVSKLSERDYKNLLIERTKFLYEPDYVYKRHTNGLASHFASGKVSVGDAMTFAVLEIMKHRALTDLFLDTSDYPKIFGMEIGFYVQANGLEATWQRFNEYFASVNPSAQASGQ